MTSTPALTYTFRRAGLDLFAPTPSTPCTGDRVTVVDDWFIPLPPSMAWVVLANGVRDQEPVMVNRTSLSPEA